jgi:ATP-dependent Clp protease ATP-binding subunit ClpB
MAGRAEQGCAAVFRSHVLKMKGQTFRSSTITTIAIMSSGMLFTDDMCDALAGSLDLAEQCGHSQLLPIHSGVALLDPSPVQSTDQQNSRPLFNQVAERAHGDIQLLDRVLKMALVLTPTCSQGRPSTRPSASRHVTGMRKGLAIRHLSKTQKDTYITVDHLIQCRP